MKYLKLIAFCAAIIALLIPSLLSLNADPDLWFHMKIGLDHLHNGRLPLHDIYSFGQVRPEWISHEWLSRLFFALIYETAGAQGLLFMKDSILILFTFILAFLAWRTFGNYGVILFLLIFFQPFLSPFFNLRTQTFGFLFFILSLVLIESAKKHDSRYVFLLPLVAVLWTNMHGSFLPGLVLTALGLLFYRPRNSWRILCLSAAATLVNPYGFKLHLYVVEQLISTRTHVQVSEWRGLDADHLPYFVLLIFIPLCLFTAAKKAGNRFFLFLFAVGGVAACFAMRFTPVFAIASFLLSCSLALTISQSESLSPAIRSVLDKLNRLPTLLIFFVIISALNCPAMINHDTKSDFPSGDASFYPTGAVNFLGSHYESGNIALPFYWGGYVIWTLGPDFKVSADGRNITLYEPEYFEKVARGCKEGILSDFLASETPADFILVEKASPLAPAISKDGGWRIIYFDNISILWERTSRVSSPRPIISNNTPKAGISAT